jgi:hypothetical protein
VRRWLPAVLGAFALAGACAPEIPADSPIFVRQLIERMQAAPVANPPASVWKYQYQGRTVYYVPPSCCDVPSELYDADGNVLCGPDGGLTGTGDGRCPDFFETRTGDERVWQDPRRP